jgi:RNA polymerase sigma-70 factor (ECF subfamily)
VVSTNVVDGPTVSGHGATRFEAAFTRHYPRVFRLLAGLVGPDEADDAAQEVFLRLYHSPVLQQSDDQLAAWLYRVALNTGYNLIRSRRRADNRLQRVGRLAEPDEMVRQDDLNPALAVSAREEAALVRQALTALSETHRSVLLLRHAGLSYAEVAATAGVKPGSVGTLLARAEAHLRAEYQRLAASPLSGSTAEENPHDRMP